MRSMGYFGLAFRSFASTLMNLKIVDCTRQAICILNFSRRRNLYEPGWSAAIELSVASHSSTVSTCLYKQAAKAGLVPPVILNQLFSC